MDVYSARFVMVWRETDQATTLMDMYDTCLANNQVRQFVDEPIQSQIDRFIYGCFAHFTHWLGSASPLPSSEDM